jgi:hypothetical protein
MDVGSEELLRDMSNAINFELSSKIEINQKGITPYFKRGKKI